MVNSLYHFDTSEADKVCLFFEKVLVHWQGKWHGQSFALTAWQRKFLRDIFGWKRTSDNKRKTKEVFLSCGRKQGKTCLAAGIALYLLFCDGEYGASIYSVGADTEQAKLCFETAKQFVISSPVLEPRSNIYLKSITYEQTNSSYKVVSADANLKHGANLSGAILDEIHCYPHRELYDVVKTSMGAREQPLLISITTAGFDRTSICYELHNYAENVRDGIIQDDSFYPLIFTADKDADISKPETWESANPNYNITVSSEYYEQEYNKAKNSAAYENTFRRLYLNQWTEQSVRWISMRHWDVCGEITFDVAKLVGQPCYAGLDLSTTTDMTALVLLFNLDDKYQVLPFFFLPRLTAMEKDAKLKSTYLAWANEGHLILTDGNVVDYDLLRVKINELNTVYNVKELAVDRWNSTQLQTQLMGDGLEVVPFGQGFRSMNSPTKQLEALVISEKIAHNNHPILRWHAANATVRTDPAGNLKPDKEKSVDKIDGIVALVMALGRQLVELKQENVSVYEDRGILIL